MSERKIGERHQIPRAYRLIMRGDTKWSSIIVGSTNGTGKDSSLNCSGLTSLNGKPQSNGDERYSLDDLQLDRIKPQIVMNTTSGVIYQATPTRQQIEERIIRLRRKLMFFGPF